MEHGDDPKGKRKMLTKQASRRGRGRTTGSSSNPAQRASYDRVAHEQYVEEEEALQRIGFTIPYGGCPGTPLHLTEFDGRYMRQFDGEMLMGPPGDSRPHPVINYSKSWKLTEEARRINPYAVCKNLGFDYRFWNEVHSNFYATAVLATRRTKITKIQYIDFNEIQEKHEPEFDRVIRACHRFELSDIMAFWYDWNEEVLAQFHATYFYDQTSDEVHWMTDGRHYRIDFVTFSWILGFGEERRSFTYIHDELTAEIRDISYMWKDRRVADGRRSGLQSFYYIMNNIIRNTVHPKDGVALDINDYVRNVLARFAPGGDKFIVPQFMWHELRLAMEDGRKGLPYAPYLMFVIERVTGIIFPKDGVHTIYKIEKTQPAAAWQTAGGSFSAREDIPESSRSGSRRGKTMKKFGAWLKAIFTSCTYAARTSYEDRLENWEAYKEARERAGLPSLPPVQSPPRFDNLPSLSDLDDDSNEEDEEEQPSEHESWEQETLFGSQQRQRQAQGAHRRSTRFTATTHRQGRARIDSSDDDDDNGGAGTATGTSRAAGVDDVDWENL